MDHLLYLSCADHVKIVKYFSCPHLYIDLLKLFKEIIELILAFFLLGAVVRPIPGQAGASITSYVSEFNTLMVKKR